MFGKSITKRRGISIAVVFASAVLLAGCFDLQFDLTLHNDGSGTMVAKTTLNKEMSAMAAKDKDKPSGSLLAKNNKNVRQTAKNENGIVSMEETVEFKRLSDIALEGDGLEVTDLGRSIFGVDRTRIRWDLGADKKDKDREGGDMAAQVFAGHYLTVNMQLPCNVETAAALSLDGKQIVPVVKKSLLNGSTVQWRIPLEQLFAGGSNAQIDVTCWSWYGIPAGKTRH